MSVRFFSGLKNSSALACIRASSDTESRPLKGIEPQGMSLGDA
jgi:hypothetical protein